jgi:hypothetical protein
MSTTKKKPDETTAVIPAEPPQHQPPAQAQAGWNACRTFQEAFQLAELVAKSAALPDVRNAGVAMLKILAGAELGLGPFAALTGVHIIEGRPSVGSHLIAATIRRSGCYDYRVVHSDATLCELAFLRLVGGKWQVEGHTILSMQEAMDQGFAISSKTGKLKDTYRRHPKDMLFARCLTQGYRQFCPDAIGGAPLYDPDELDRNTAGPVVDAEYQTIPPKQAGPGDEPAEEDPRAEALARSEAARQERYGPGSSADAAARQASYEQQIDDHQDEARAAVGEGAEGNQEPPADEPSGVPEVWVARFAQAMGILNVSGEAMTGRLQEAYGVDSYRKLNAAQAEEALQKMEAAVKAKRAKERSKAG